MKPTFALDFRNDAITLLHRTPRGWQLVGQVALDAPDLDEALSYLRATALGLSPRGIVTKLVIPNSQILYTQVNVPAPEIARKRKHVLRALEGLTPYPIADLAFDVWGDGPEFQVAVIAKETLAEAEAFATQHRFNPVSFVAVPENGLFIGEPWFGATSCAAEFLPEGEKLGRDLEPVAILSRDLPGEASPAPEPSVPEDLPETEPAAPAIPAADDDSAPMAAAVAAQPVEPAPAGYEPDLPLTAIPAPQPYASPAAVVEENAPRPEPAPQDPIAQDVAAQPIPPPFDPPPSPPAQPLTEPVLALAAPVPDQEFEQALAVSLAEIDSPATPVLAPTTIPEPSPSAPMASEQPAAQTPPASPIHATEMPSPVPDTTLAPKDSAVQDRMADEAPIALDVVDDLPDDPTPAPVAPPAGPAAAATSVLDPSIRDDIPPQPAASIMMAFASRRAAEAAAAETATKSGGKSASAKSAGGRAPALGAVTATRTGPAAKVTTLPTRNAPPNLAAVPQRGAEPAVPAASAKPAIKGSASSKTLRGIGALVTDPGIPGSKERRPVVQTVTPPTGPTSAASAAAATLSRPGAKPYSGGLGNRTMADRGKPRYLGLILTGILLVFLALVALWSTLFLESSATTTFGNPATADATAAAEATPPDATNLSGAPLPTIDDEALADLQIPVDPAPPADAEPATDVVAAAPAPAPAETPEAAPVTNLDSETSSVRQPAADPQDEIFLAAMDAPPMMPDALSLPRPVDKIDPPPGRAAPPPPFGTVYQFDAAGLIIPTPEGILTPEGVVVKAGRPALVPPQRPATLAPPAESVADAADPTATASQTAVEAAVEAAIGFEPPAPVADPALAGFRPRARPEGLTPPTRNADDDASLAPQQDSRFASLRPLARPAARVAAAATAPADPITDLGAQGASLTAQANANAAAADTNPLTLAVSRKPAQRPRDMSRAVEAAVAVASRQPDPAPPVEETAPAVEPEADGEPEIANAMPRLPTKASVSKQATFVNAINLSKVNLIGVYGTQSSRYALIRQTNGRYKKVKVGDNFDGGRVAAITASEVRYQKSGKMLTLALPKG